VDLGGGGSEARRVSKGWILDHRLWTKGESSGGGSEEEGKKNWAIVSVEKKEMPLKTWIKTYLTVVVLWTGG